ncbi:hypothetical protein [Salipiger bermudensis]|uniref:Cap15 family cyclic dinucleotide receptor domain-containing protein n=1 Tax=Salipiger bermudensis TaxID=344736 RepID=UPI001A8CDED1|nr:hypothetical protein [Salipiger bermudensis]MBN9676481.1 hypothetical protein [Salipiger bermudensis]
MLHLLPFKIMSIALIAGVTSLVMLMVYLGVYGNNVVDDYLSIMKLVSYGITGFPLLFYLAWRWVPQVQAVIFPYLGGVWEGSLTYDGINGKGERKITLTINQTPFHVSLILDSEESVSRTLSAQADRDAGANRDRVYYVFQNERKEGAKNPGIKYRGLAVLGIQAGTQLTLAADYFTETRSTGQLHLFTQKPHPWWSLWK